MWMIRCTLEENVDEQQITVAFVDANGITHKVYDKLAIFDAGDSAYALRATLVELGPTLRFDISRPDHLSDENGDTVFEIAHAACSISGDVFTRAQSLNWPASGWLDIDNLQHQLALETGLFPSATTFAQAKPYYWTDNPIGNHLVTAIRKLVANARLEPHPDDETILRWRH